MATPSPPTPTVGCHVDVDAVLFDLDGVLVDSTASVERLWRAFALRHGLDPDELLQDLHGRRMVDIMAAAVPHLSSVELVEQARRFDLEEARDARATAALPGALELTRELEERRVPWAIVTSGTSAVSSARIAAVGLAAPPVLVTADEVAAGKPAPDPYLTAASRLGVDPTACVVVEDAPSGIRSGAAAGARTVAVTTSHPPAELARASHVVRAVADLTLTLGPHQRPRVLLACLRHRGS